MESYLSNLVFWHWFALAIFLGILDVVLGANFFFIWCGLSAAVVGILMLVIPKMLWQYQFLIFGFGVMASLVIWRLYLRKPLQISDQPTLNRRSRQNIGMICTLEEPIVNGHGKVRLGDTVWRVHGEDLPKGTKVKVVDVEGVILKVERI